jgi:hypothetical protein
LHLYSLLFAISDFAIKILFATFILIHIKLITLELFIRLFITQRFVACSRADNCGFNSVRNVLYYFVKGLEDLKICV